MMKSIIAENGVTFKELEKNIYSWICQIGRQFTSEFLERYDRMLMEGRDRKKYRHKGLRQTTVKTVYGEVTYRRAVYEAVEEDGFKHYSICWMKPCSLAMSGSFPQTWQNCW